MPYLLDFARADSRPFASLAEHPSSKYRSSTISGSSLKRDTVMSRNEKDELPPSYSEVPNFSRPHAHRGQRILDQLTLTRAQHIQSIIDTHIIPLVEERASYGIAQTTIAMLPSDIPLPAVQEKSEFSFDTDTSKAVEVIGFASEEEPSIVRLEGQMNRTEFWRVQAVIVELERVLRDSLNASPQIRSPTREGNEFEAPLKQKRNFFAKFAGRGEEERSPSGNPEVGVRKIEESGLVLVKARLEEISLRTLSEFGLYDTMSKQCVIIRIDARC